MLIEAFSSRFTMESAHEIAANILAPAQEGVRVKPEELQPQVTATEQPQAEIAAVGDGKIEFVLTRVDSRLLHGQVATAWTKATHPTRIIVVSDAVAKDDLRKN